MRRIFLGQFKELYLSENSNFPQYKTLEHIYLQDDAKHLFCVQIESRFSLTLEKKIVTYIILFLFWPNCFFVNVFHFYVRRV